MKSGDTQQLIKYEITTLCVGVRYYVYECPLGFDRNFFVRTRYCIRAKWGGGPLALPSPSRNAKQINVVIGALH